MKRDAFQAIADPTRRAILMLLASQAMTPGAIAGHFEGTRQSISKHIKILKDAQLLKQESAGREIYYHVNPKKMQEIDKWTDAFKRLIEKRFNQLDDLSIKSKSRTK